MVNFHRIFNFLFYQCLDAQIACTSTKESNWTINPRQIYCITNKINTSRMNRNPEGKLSITRNRVRNYLGYFLI